MDHVAIMNRTWKLIEKILSGRKTVESRWYKARAPPWNRLNKGDIVYFKDAGEKVTARAEVSDVMQFENLTEDKIKSLIKEYGGEGKICFSSPQSAFEWAKGKKYCILAFLKNPREIEPFDVDKSGFGNACAWMCAGDINKVKAKRKNPELKKRLNKEIFLFFRGNMF